MRRFKKNIFLHISASLTIPLSLSLMVQTQTHAVHAQVCLAPPSHIPRKTTAVCIVLTFILLNMLSRREKRVPSSMFQMSDDDYCSFSEREQATAPTLDRAGLAHLLGRPPAYTPPGQPKRSSSRINFLLGVTIAQFILTGLLLYGGVSCELYTGGFYCSYYTNIWMPCFCIVNSLVGIVAAIICHDVVLFAHLFMSAIGIAVGTASAVISVIDYTTIGTKAWCHKHGVFCLIPEYDAERIRHIGQHYGRENFLECVWQFKIGLTIVVLSVIGVICVVVLKLLSIILCALRIKRWPRLSH